MKFVFVQINMKKVLYYIVAGEKFNQMMTLLFKNLK